MLYQLDQGKTEDWIAQQCKRTGRPLPEKIQNAPEIFQGLELYLWAFTDLNTCRGWSFSCPLPIPWSAIQAYGDTYRFSPRQRCRLEVLCRKMDEAYLKWHQDKNGDKS